MAYGIIRVREITAGEVGATDIHNARRYEELGIEAPPNIQKKEGLHGFNTYNVIVNGENKENATLKEAIDLKLKEKNVKVRSNSVVALEFVVSASPEFWEVYSPSGWFQNCQKWLEERYGKDNTVAIYQHYDESNPHAHIILTPIIEKEIKWKNQKGEGKKKENRLCARDLTGNKELLTKLQDDYHEFIKRYSRHGVEFYRGTKATNDFKKYSKHTDHELGQIRAQFNDLDKRYAKLQEMLKEGKISAEMAKKETENLNVQAENLNTQKKALETNLETLKQQSIDKENRRDKYNDGDNWKKGFDPFQRENDKKKGFGL